MMAQRTVVSSVAIAAALLSILGLATVAGAWAQQAARLPKIAVRPPAHRRLKRAL